MKRFFRMAMEIGVKGYLLKENAPDEIIAGVHAVSDGRTYVSAAVSVYLLERPPGAANAEGDILDCLTPAERNLLKLVALGNSSKDIGQQLSLSYRTIENHREPSHEHLSQAGHQRAQRPAPFRCPTQSRFVIGDCRLPLRLSCQSEYSAGWRRGANALCRAAPPPPFH
jgi:hypothetical protein